MTSAQTVPAIVPVAARKSTPRTFGSSGLALGALVSRPQRRLDLLRIEQIDAIGRARNDEHALGPRRLQVLHLFVDVVRNAAEQAAFVTVGQSNDQSSLRACDHVGVRPGLGNPTIHAITLSELCRSDHARERRTGSGRMRQGDMVLSRGRLPDDKPFAGVAIVGGGIHFRDRPAGLAVSRQQSHQPVGAIAVEFVVGGQCGMANRANGCRTAVLDAEIDLLRPLLADIGRGDRRELGK